jgi:hypothetical protein
MELTPEGLRTIAKHIEKSQYPLAAHAIREAADEIERLRKANVEPDVGKRDQWRPIATAPEDGEFLAGLHVRHRDPKTGTVTIYEEQHVVALDEETGDIADHYDHGWRLLDYEFWKPLDPLPEAPTVDLIVGSAEGSAAPAE